MKKSILSGLTAAGLLLAGTAFNSGGTVQAVESEEPIVCYEQKEVPKYKTEHQYQKQVKTVKVGRITGNVTVVSDWDWWSPPSTKWSSSGVEVLEEGVHSNLRGDDTIFYDWTRYYRYVKNGETRQVEDGTEIIEVEVPCPTKDDEVTYGEWEGTPPCGVTEYVQTRTVTTISFTWNGDGFDEHKVVTTEERTVETPFVPCFVPPPFVPPVTTDPPTTVPPEPCEYNPDIQADDPECVPPTVGPETGEVDSQSPPPATPQPAAPQAAGPAAPAPAATLPATGLDSTGIMALLALLVTSLGGTAMLIARRRGVTS